MSPVQGKLNKRDELRLLVNSRHPVITIETTEEERVERLLYQIGDRLEVPVYTWSVTKGLARLKGEPLYQHRRPGQALANISIINGDAIFLLKDFARYCENDKICRRLRELGEKFRTARRSIVITGANMNLPPDLEGDAVPFAIGLPELEDLLPESAKRSPISIATVVSQFQPDGYAASRTSPRRPHKRRSSAHAALCVLSRGKADPAVMRRFTRSQAQHSSRRRSP